MPNTLNGINLAKVANKSLDFMSRTFVPLRSFHRDFSAELAQQGASVTTRVPGAVSAVDVSGGYTAQAVATTPVTITLDQNPGFPWAFTDAEIYKAANNFDWLMNIFVLPATEAVLKAFMDYSLGLVKAAQFPTVITKTAAQWDADAMADAGISLSTNKAPKSERTAILLPTYYGNVAKDAVVEQLNTSGSTDALRELRINRIRGFETHDYTDVPDNGEQLAGICLHPSGLCMAARGQVVPPDFKGRIENVVEPISGLPLQWRIWYDSNNKKTMMCVEALFGVSPGNANAIVRIAKS